jgi:hypothetical protein
LRCWNGGSPRGGRHRVHPTILDRIAALRKHERGDYTDCE